MSAPDYRFRVDPKRAVYVLGDFGDDLLKEVIPKIVELRSEPQKPLSVVINSFGGEATCLDAIVAALGVKDCDGGTLYSENLW